ncbi:phosphate/phosphite/phosphonate ABC transporter substrate-binding protein [Methylomagnum sp.]
MTYNFTISPDFGPEHLAGWYVFNTWLQRALGVGIHLEIYPNFNSQRQAIEADKVDLIYANPYDASMLVREKGFTPLAKPKGKSDEAIIAASVGREIMMVEDLRPGMSVATTADPDVHMMGMIMLEPASLSANNINLQICDSYVLVAKQLLKGASDAGIFLAEAFNDLSSVVRSQLRILVRSEIQVVHHSLMLGPAMAPQRERLQAALLSMLEDPKGRGVLTTLGFERWEEVDQEEMEFMIDLVETLLV